MSLSYTEISAPSLAIRSATDDLRRIAFATNCHETQDVLSDAVPVPEDNVWSKMGGRSHPFIHSLSYGTGYQRKELSPEDNSLTWHFMEIAAGRVYAIQNSFDVKIVKIANGIDDLNRKLKESLMAGARFPSTFPPLQKAVNPDELNASIDAFLASQPAALSKEQKGAFATSVREVYAAAKSIHVIAHPDDVLIEELNPIVCKFLHAVHGCMGLLGNAERSLEKILFVLDAAFDFKPLVDSFTLDDLDKVLDILGRVGDVLEGGEITGQSQVKE